MTENGVTLRNCRSMLRRVLSSAEDLGLVDGDSSRVTFERGVEGWRVNDPDNVCYLFLTVSKGLGETKAAAWRTLVNMNEVMFAVRVKYPEIGRNDEQGK